jgi:hypothetical protein
VSRPGAAAQEPTPATQASAPLHRFPSEHSTGAPPHVPALHASSRVHAFPSLHAVPTVGTNVHPVAGLQASAVHALVSTHVRGLLVQVCCAVQRSPIVH